MDGKRGCNVGGVDAGNNRSVRHNVVEVTLELIGLLRFLIDGRK